MKIQKKLMAALLLLSSFAVLSCSSGGDDNPIISYGRYVAFHSDATNLVTDDTNGQRDVFVHDGQTGQTIRANVSSAGDQAAGGPSEFSALSADGIWVAFHSDATNLVANDTNGERDIFMHNNVTGQTIRVNVSTAGAQAVGGESSTASLSADGRYVAFHSGATNLVADDTNGLTDVFARDNSTNQTIRVSMSTAGDQAVGGSSSRGAVSADGRYVAFQSNATNLVAGDTNGLRDIFVHDCINGETIRVNVSTAGDQSVDGDSDRPVISSDGRYIAFQSTATNLVAGDTNGLTDIFVHDRQTGETTRVNVSTAGDQATGGISEKAIMSWDGRYVGFHSSATNLVAGDTNGWRDIFVHDRQTGETTRVNVSTAGNQATGGISEYPTMSPDGRYVAWQSDATNLVADDTNGLRDIFVRNITDGVTTRANLSSAGDEALGGGSYDPSY